MRRAFVSHSTADDSYVAEMESFLRAAGFEVFNDVSAIKPDEKFWPEIEKGISEAETLVVVITLASNSSDWVKREVEYARSLSKRIIPVWIEDCPVPPIFADRDVIDFRPHTRAERRFEISRIVKNSPAELIGREDEMKLLNDAWEKVLRVDKGRPHVLTLVALGGEGKTSLVAKWAAELAGEDWPGCDAAFAWSFYSQGTREQVAASSDLFLKEALTFFGNDEDKDFAASPAGAYEKGQRLARIVGQWRSLLILDGLEPLQYVPGPPHNGMLKDQGITALLKGLAAASHGLCVVTTRYSLPDLRAFWQTTAPEVKLLRLSRAAGVHLLQSFGVKGSLLRNISFHREQVNEFEKLVEDVQGHALTLNLLGTYLRDAHAGNIRKRDLVKLEEADDEEQGGHAFRVMEAYEREFEREGDKGQRALAVLRLLGLFDRPLTSDCLEALLQAPAIPGLTEPLVHLTEVQRNLAFRRLENAGLLTVNRDASGALDTLDTHALIRGYFASQAKVDAPAAWREANSRLANFFVSLIPRAAMNLIDLEILYRAVRHACAAGQSSEALLIYRERIQQGDRRFSLELEGTIQTDLVTLRHFFDSDWTHPAPTFSDVDKAYLLHTVGLQLWHVGDLEQAVKVCGFAKELHSNQYDASRAVRRQSEAALYSGKIADSIRFAEESLCLAHLIPEEGRKKMLQIACVERTLAHARFQGGDLSEESIRKPKIECAEPLSGHESLYVIYEFLLIELRLHLRLFEEAQLTVRLLLKLRTDQPILHALGTYFNAYVRLKTEPPATLDVWSLHREFDRSVREIDATGHDPHRVRSYLGRAEFFGIVNQTEKALEDLATAESIATRSKMRLYLADIHLHRARLFFREAQYPWESPKADLAAAEKLINNCGYHRRDEELADAKAAILSK